MSVDTDGNKTKAYLGETIILLEKDSAELNMGVMEQTVTLQDGARDNVVVVYGDEKTYIEPVINSPKTNKAAEKIQAVARGNQAREEVNKKRKH